MEMTSYDNYEIVDTDSNKSEVEMDQNHTYVEIYVFEMDNAPDPSSTNE